MDRQAHRGSEHGMTVKLPLTRAPRRSTSARLVLAAHVQEADYQHTIESALTRRHWSFIHVRKAQLQGNWQTPASKGFPDLLALRGPYQIACELKRDGRYPTPAQRLWLHRFAAVPGCLTWVLRPGDRWDDVSGWLDKPQTAPRIYGWTPQTSHACDTDTESESR
jgi:hypothetical protein